MWKKVAKTYNLTSVTDLNVTVLLNFLVVAIAVIVQRILLV